MKRVANEEGLPFVERKWTYNSRLAQELGKWAESMDRGEAFHHAVFRAYFAEAKNIGKIPTLIEIASTLGLPPDAAREVLENRAFKGAVDSDWSRSRKLGITGVPTFFMKGEALVGAQPYEILKQFVTENRIIS